MNRAESINVASDCDKIVLSNVSKFYGDILGVNRISLEIESGITGLVGPNGSGKSTLMNLIAGLIPSTQGSVEVRGVTPAQPETFFHQLGYCTQYDSFPAGINGYDFIRNTLLIHGYDKSTAGALAQQSLQQVDLVKAAKKSVDAYSKGMRQRIKLAQAICHQPDVLILDEPLNGLDPMARAKIIALFRELADAGKIIVISSQILHEVDLISDRVVLLNSGYLVAEGDLSNIQSETGEVMKIFIRSPHANDIAARVFDLEHVVEAQLHYDGEGLFIRSSDADAFFLAFNQHVIQQGWSIESMGPADETVEAVYQHLIVEQQVAT
ncbi:MAG: ABC transporter [Gammaproteobacteria bacterium]|nr:ABC transporter [Gammaproteobacteria bacterium]|tara:strand:+ start:4778 stop:5749 length:972 start_codon:yes stop_codon:yes gene_type:complete